MKISKNTRLYPFFKKIIENRNSFERERNDKITLLYDFENSQN